MLPDGETEFLGIQKEKKTYVRIAAFIIGVYVIYAGIANGKLYISALGLAVAAAALMFRDTAVTEKGIELRYLLPGWHFESIWNWDVITFLMIDHTRFKPDVGIMFGRQGVSRICVLQKSEVDSVKAFTRKMHPGIKISDEK